MIWFIGGLLFAAALIAYLVWRRHLQSEYMSKLARHAGRRSPLYPWEQPTIVLRGGIHDWQEEGEL